MSKRVQQRPAARVVRDQMAREDRRRRTMWVSIVAVAVLVLSGLVGWSVYASQRAGGYAVPRHAVQDGSGIPVGDGPVRVDLYVDFMCPHCRTFESGAGATLRKMVDERRITLVYHPVAFLDAASTTRYSTRSAASFGCATDGDRQRQYADALFARQPAEGGPGLSDDELVRIGGTVGLLDPSFARCVRDGRYISWTRHVTDAASRSQVNGTPAVFVDGRRTEADAAAVSAAVDARS